MKVTIIEGNSDEIANVLSQLASKNTQKNQAASTTYTPSPSAATIAMSTAVESQYR